MQTNIPYHNTKLDKLILKNIRQISTPRPRGLWYARDFAWINFVKNNPTMGKIYDNMFRLDLTNVNILIMNTKEKIDAFHNKFCLSDDFQIYWSKVAQEYDGVEIASEDLIARKSWSKLWSVNSGCIWNTDNLYIIKDNIDVYQGNNMTIEEIQSLIKERAKKRTPYEQTKVSFKEKVHALLPVIKSLNAEEISIEQQVQRLQVCSDCEHLTLVNDVPACGICKCNLKIDNTRIINLVNKKETDAYGCKHPSRFSMEKE